ncbi:MAG: Mth938-like domain-containing protein [Beijerinckiaceae bacterium]
MEGFLPGAHPIDAYGAGGFSFAGMSHRGSILALPSGIRAWDAREPAEISVSSLAALFAEPAGAVEHILIGTGPSFMPLPPELRKALRAHGIVGEPMATGAAARTYNILLGEKRRVAAALIAAP